MKVQILKRVAVLAILILAIQSVYAQNGSISGLVTDFTTKETIIGGNVSLEGTLHRAVTDIDGKFSISGVKGGSYNLIITYIGYRPQTIPVVISSSREASVKVELKSEATQMQSVTVTGRANMQNATALMAERK